MQWTPNNGYTSVVRYIVRLSVRLDSLSVCMSRSGIVSKRINIIIIPLLERSLIILVYPAVLDVFAKFWQESQDRR